MSPRSRRVLLVALLLLLAAVGAYSYRFLQARNANAVSQTAPRAEPTQPVLAAPVLAKAMAVRLEAIGTVQVEHSVAVRTRVDSQITAVFVKDGQHVEVGQPLFALDRRQLEAQRAQAEAVLARDQVQLDFAQRQLERRQPQISSEAAIDEARTNLAALQASIRADKANLESLIVQLSYTHVDSPIAGRLGTVGYKVGNVVKASDPQPLVTINQLRPIYVAFSVPQSYLTEIRDELSKAEVPVTATLPDMQQPPLRGRVAYLENAVDSATSTVSVKAEFGNQQEQLWPGEFVNVLVTLRTEPHALVVPAQAVQQGQNGPYVFVVQEGETAEPRTVTVNRTIDGLSVISNGLKVGETVVVEGQQRLVSGTRVEIKSGQGDKAQGATKGGQRDARSEEAGGDAAPQDGGSDASQGAQGSKHP